MARELRFGVRLTGDSQGARTAMRATESDLDRLQRELRQTRNSAERTDRSFRNWAGGMNLVRGAIGPLIGVAGAGMLARLSQGALADVAAMDELADTADINVEKFQELTKAFSDLVGVSEQDTAAALRRFNRRLGLAREGTGAAVNTLDRLNITLEQDTTSALDEAVRKLANMEDGADRAAAASELFGEDSGPRLAAALAQGEDALDATIQKLRDQGRIMDEETAEAARELNDRFGEIADTLDTTFKRAVVASVGYLSELTGAIGDFFDVTTAEQVTKLEQQLETIENRIERIRDSAHGEFVPGLGGGQQNLERLEAQRREIEEQLRLIRERREVENAAADERNEKAREYAAAIEVANRNITEEQRLLQPIVDQMGDILTLQDAINKGQGVEGRQLAIDRAYWQDMAGAVHEYEDALVMADGTIADLSLNLDDAEDSAKDFNDEMQNAISGWANSFSSELADAVVGAEASFDQILQSFQKMLVQMVIQKQIVEPFLNSTFSTDGGGSQGGRAEGGTVRAGGIYQVAERGEPETLRAGGKTYLLMGSQGGQVNAAGQGGGAGAGDVYVNVENNSGEEATVRQSRGPNMERLVDIQVGRSIREGEGRRAVRETFNVQPRTG